MGTLLDQTMKIQTLDPSQSRMDRFGLMGSNIDYLYFHALLRGSLIRVISL